MSGLSVVPDSLASLRSSLQAIESEIRSNEQLLQETVAAKYPCILRTSGRLDRMRQTSGTLMALVQGVERNSSLRDLITAPPGSSIPSSRLVIELMDMPFLAWLMWLRRRPQEFVATCSRAADAWARLPVKTEQLHLCLGSSMRGLVNRVVASRPAMDLKMRSTTAFFEMLLVRGLLIFKSVPDILAAWASEVAEVMDSADPQDITTFASIAAVGAHSVYHASGLLESHPTDSALLDTVGFMRDCPAEKTTVAAFEPRFVHIVGELPCGEGALESLRIARDRMVSSLQGLLARYTPVGTPELMDLHAAWTLLQWPTSCASELADVLDTGLTRVIRSRVSQAVALFASTGRAALSLALCRIAAELQPLMRSQRGIAVPVWHCATDTSGCTDPVLAHWLVGSLVEELLACVPTELGSLRMLGDLCDGMALRTSHGYTSRPDYCSLVVAATTLEDRARVEQTVSRAMSDLTPSDADLSDVDTIMGSFGQVKHRGTLLYMMPTIISPGLWKLLIQMESTLGHSKSAQKGLSLVLEKWAAGSFAEICQETPQTHHVQYLFDLRCVALLTGSSEVANIYAAVESWILEADPCKVVIAAENLRRVVVEFLHRCGGRFSLRPTLPAREPQTSGQFVFEDDIVLYYPSRIQVRPRLPLVTVPENSLPKPAPSDQVAGTYSFLMALDAPGLSNFFQFRS
ncbi:MAG: uncharacterized protein KVP18_000612 [Porospora cf. gigantea A]|uniref:uncharacterized protein n=2 Tax=Porospora cf. gigantea A TaxID=2853593 RepID=UPI00355ACCA7|nr:MAG: hypothetical protein KVP18_000612 [Porospora cf. gigantea A]